MTSLSPQTTASDRLFVLTHQKKPLMVSCVSVVCAHGSLDEAPMVMVRDVWSDAGHRWVKSGCRHLAVYHSEVLVWRG